MALSPRPPVATKSAFSLKNRDVKLNNINFVYNYIRVTKHYEGVINYNRVNNSFGRKTLSSIIPHREKYFHYCKCKKNNYILYILYVLHSYIYIYIYILNYLTLFVISFKTKTSL